MKKAIWKGSHNPILWGENKPFCFPYLLTGMILQVGKMDMHWAILVFEKPSFEVLKWLKHVSSSTVYICFTSPVALWEEDLLKMWTSIKAWCQMASLWKDCKWYNFKIIYIYIVASIRLWFTWNTVRFSILEPSLTKEMHVFGSFGAWVIIRMGRFS